MPQQPLFTREPIGRFLDRKLRALTSEVDGIGDDALLAADEEKLAGDLAARHAVACPVLREDEQEMDQTMAPLTVSSFAGLGFRGGGDRRVEAPRYELTVPYDGDEEVFFLTPNPHTFGGAMPQAEIRPGEVLVT